MWQSILDWARYFLKHKEQTEKNSADIKEQESTINNLTATVQHLAFEQQRQREKEAHEREILALRLENILLRSDRSLPSAFSKSDVNVEELLRLVEELKNENEQLRKRLEQAEIHNDHE